MLGTAADSSMESSSALATQAYRYFGENKVQKHERIYKEGTKEMRKAMLKLDRETNNLIKCIDTEKTRARKEIKELGDTSTLRPIAEGIAMLQRQVDRNVWLKCRLQSVLAETRLAKGQLALANTVGMLTRGMMLLNRNDHLLATYASFQKNLAELEYNTGELAGQFQFEQDDFFEEADAQAALDQVLAELAADIPWPEVPGEPEIAESPTGEALEEPAQEMLEEKN